MNINNIEVIDLEEVKPPKLWSRLIKCENPLYPKRWFLFRENGLEITLDPFTLDLVKSYNVRNIFLRESEKELIKKKLININ